MTTTVIEAIDRSYAVQRTLPVGTYVTVTETLNRRIVVMSVDPSTWEAVTLNPGDKFFLIGFSNEGFNGITASLRLENGKTLHGISAGYLDWTS